MTTITKSIIFKWNLLDRYGVTSDGKIYNRQTMRQIKRTVNGYTVGYWLNGKFYTPARINTLAEKITKQYCPF